MLRLMQLQVPGTKYNSCAILLFNKKIFPFCPFLTKLAPETVESSYPNHSQHLTFQNKSLAKNHQNTTAFGLDLQI